MLKQQATGGSDAQPPAAIVNLSSVAGRSGRPFAAHYSAAKWAVISITQSAAEWLAPHGITVNAICPGIVETPMWEDIDRVQSERFGLERGGWMQKSVEEMVPLQRAAAQPRISARQSPSSARTTAPTSPARLSTSLAGWR